MINQSLFIPFSMRNLLQESILCSEVITMLKMQDRDLPIFLWWHYNKQS